MRWLAALVLAAGLPACARVKPWQREHLARPAMQLQVLATLTGDDAGFDHADPGEDMFDPLFCDPTFTRGLPPAPHGCDTSSASGRAYFNITSSGDIAVIDLDADQPTFALVPTGGSGGGKTIAAATATSSR